MSSEAIEAREEVDLARGTERPAANGSVELHKAPPGERVLRAEYRVEQTKQFRR